MGDGIGEARGSSRTLGWGTSLLSDAVNTNAAGVGDMVIVDLLLARSLGNASRGGL